MKEVQVVMEKLEQSKDNARKIIEEMAAAHDRERRLMSSAIYELGLVIRQLMGSKDSRVSQMMLRKLMNGKNADGIKQGVTIVKNDSLDHS